jgi:hypothetical protein
MFPVKRVRRIVATSLGFGSLLLGLTSCGYRAVYGGADPEQRLAVVASPSRVPNAGALQAVLAGARSELGRAGVLRGGDGYPRLVVDVLRVDEVGTGIAATGDLPLARGAAVAVVGRAWVEPGPDAPSERDTGDTRRSERVTAGSSAAADRLLHDEALDAAGRRLGRALAQRVMGEPTPADEPL